MNVFEDLIEELKEENLLEQTVTDVNPPLSVSAAPAALESSSTFSSTGSSGSDAANRPRTESSSEFGALFDSRNGQAKSADDTEVFKKRAVDEVSCLQMVEHVLTSIEREHMKIAPATFDDLKVKKALHDYLRLLGSSMSSETLEAEGRLLLETEEWYNALSARDREVSVSNVRRFCENSRPVLSTQALLSLARFYRISQFCEPVRSKFDFVITRLFAKDAGTEKRRSLFDNSEMAQHIKDLYDGWASVSMFTSPVTGNQGPEAVESFKLFIVEAEAAESFDALIRNNFFDRVRLFKERMGEVFFVPEVTAAAIDSNVRIGNRFVDLLVGDKARLGTDTIEEKYAYDHDIVISGAASKTLGVTRKLNTEPESGEQGMDTRRDRAAAVRGVDSRPKETKSRVESDREPLFGINKWLAIAAIVLIAASSGLFIWTQNFATDQPSVLVAAAVDLKTSGLSDQLTTARITGDTFYGVVQPSWDSLSPEQQNEFLARASAFAHSKGLRNVNLMNYKGLTIAYTDGTRSELALP